MRTVFVFLVLALMAPTLRAEEPPTFEGGDVQAWAERLSRSGWGPHMKALAAGREAAVPVVEELLGHENPRVRERAARVVCWMQDSGRPLLALLLQMVDDPVEDVREAVVDGLGTLGDQVAEDVVPVLRRVLRDADRGLILDCVRALERFGVYAKAALPELVQTLKAQDPGDLRVKWTAEAIWAIGDAGAVALVEAARSPEVTARQRAVLAETLGWGADAAAPYIGILLQSESESQAAVAQEACAHLGWRVLPLLDALRLGPSPARERVDAATLCVLRDGVLLRAVEPEDDQVRKWAPGPSVDPRTVNLFWESGEDRHNFRSYDFFECAWRDGQLRVTRFPWGMRHPVMRYSDARHVDVRFGAARAKIPGFRAAAALRMALAATGLRLEDKPRDLEEGLGVAGWGVSDSGFQIRMRFENATGVVFEESFEGMISSFDKEEFIRLEVAQEVMEELLEDVAWEPLAIREEDLARLHARCTDLAEEHWSVRACLLRIVSQLGDERFLPILDAAIRRPVDSVTRDHIHAINAYARLTAVDLREGKVTWDNVREVRGRYLEHLEAAPGGATLPAQEAE